MTQFRVSKAYGESKFSPDRYDNKVFDHKIIVDGREYYASTKNRPMEEGVEYEAELGKLYGKKEDHYYPKDIKRVDGARPSQDTPRSPSRPSSAPKSRGEQKPFSSKAMIEAACWIMATLKDKLEGMDNMNVSSVFNALKDRGLIEQVAANMDHHEPPVDDIPPGLDDQYAGDGESVPF